MRVRSFVSSLVVASLLLPSFAGAVDFSAEGPETVEWRTFVTVEVEGRRLTSEVWFPASAGPHPGIALSHGFVSDRFTVASVGRHLASWGFVVVAPNLPTPWAPDARLNASLARAIVDTWLPARSADASSYLSGKVMPGRSGVIGHSAGGLSTVLALKDAPAGTRAAGVMLDWVDSVDGVPLGQPGDLGRDALPSVWAPGAFLFAEPHSCNAQGNAVVPSALTAGPRLQLKVAGARHCDPGDPVAIGCTSACGAYDTAKAALFLGYGTAWFRRWLLDDPGTDEWLGGELYDTHVAQGRIVDVALEDVLPLAQDAVDAGEADAGAEEVDAGVAVDAGPEAVDAGSAAPDAGAPDAGVPSVEVEDAGVTDAGEGVSAPDAADAPGDAPAGGCECGQAAWSVLALPLLFRRRRSA